MEIRLGQDFRPSCVTRKLTTLCKPKRPTCELCATWSSGTTIARSIAGLIGPLVVEMFCCRLVGVVTPLLNCQQRTALSTALKYPWSGVYGHLFVFILKIQMFMMRAHSPEVSLHARSKTASVSSNAFAPSLDRALARSRARSLARSVARAFGQPCPNLAHVWSLPKASQPVLLDRLLYTMYAPHVYISCSVNLERC